MKKTLTRLGFVLPNAGSISFILRYFGETPVEDILGGLSVVYDSVSPLAAGVDAVQDTQISEDLSGLQAYVSDLYAEEQAGRVFTPEEADLFGNEAQTRAQAITGRIAQVAALLEITLPE